MPESHEGAYGSPGGICHGTVLVRMHGTAGYTGHTAAGQDALAEPGRVWAVPSPFRQGKVAKPARLGAGAGNGAIQGAILLTGAVDPFCAREMGERSKE